MVLVVIRVLEGDKWSRLKTLAGSGKVHSEASVMKKWVERDVQEEDQARMKSTISPAKPSGLSPKTGPTPKPSSFSRAAKAFGDVTGVGAVARAALEGEQKIVTELLRQARKRGVSEEDIQRAQAFKKFHDRAMVLAAILFPWLPNPALLRLVAGKPLTDLEGQPEPERKALELAKSLRTKATMAKAQRILKPSQVAGRVVTAVKRVGPSTGVKSQDRK